MLSGLLVCLPEFSTLSAGLETTQNAAQDQDTLAWVTSVYNKSEATRAVPRRRLGRTWGRCACLRGPRSPGPCTAGLLEESMASPLCKKKEDSTPRNSGGTHLFLIELIPPLPPMGPWETGALSDLAMDKVRRGQFRPLFLGLSLPYRSIQPPQSVPPSIIEIGRERPQRTTAWV